MLMAVSMAIQNVLYNLYLIQLGYDEDFVGQAAAAVSLGIALGGIPAGLLYDRFGGKATFRLATVGMVVSMVMRVLFETPTWLILWAGVNGIANAIYFVSIFPFITSQSSPKERPHLYGANMAVWTAFMMLGSFIAGFLPRIWNSMIALSTTIDAQRLSLIAGAAIGILAFIPFSFLKKDGLTPSGGRRRLLPSSGSSRAIFRGVFVLFFVGMVIGLTTPFYNVYFKRIFEIDDALIGTLISLSQLMGLFSAFLLPFIVRRWGLIVGPTLILGINAPFIFVVGLPLPLLYISIAFLFSAGMERLGEAPLMNLVMEAVDAEDRGAMSGIRLISSYGAQALAGIVGGWLVVNSGYNWLYGLAAGLQILAASAIYILFRNHRISLETAS
jgi:MFS family permease